MEKIHSRRRTALGLLVLSTLALALAGCGGNDDAAQKRLSPGDVGLMYAKAYYLADAKTQCSLTRGGDSPKCEKTVKEDPQYKAFTNASEKEKERARKVVSEMKLKSVVTKGNRAEVRVGISPEGNPDTDETLTLPLVRVKGRWLLAATLSNP